MKREILLGISFLVLFGVSSFAQTDSTSTKKVTTAMSIYADFGAITNSSMTDMRKELKAQSVDPFSSMMSSITIAHRRETNKWIWERKIILMGNGMHDDNKTDFKRADLWGVGIGAGGAPKIVSTPKLTVYIPIGVDLMYYRMRIKSNPSASLNKIVNNPGTYQAIKLGTGTVNVNAGLGLDYKTGWFKKHYDSFALSARASYHLPVLTTDQWRGENAQVNDLTSFKPNQLYLSFGIVASLKNTSKMWGGMH